MALSRTFKLATVTMNPCIFDNRRALETLAVWCAKWPYCSVIVLDQCPFIYPQKEKIAKMFYSISCPNDDGFQLLKRLLKDLDEHVKISYCDQKSIGICKSYEGKSV